LLNIKRLAYETSPAKGATTSVPASRPTTTVPVPARAGLSPAVLGERIDQFLASRGIAVPPSPSGSGSPSPAPAAPSGSGLAAEFVCEDDVRQAVLAGTKIVLDSRTIVTPSARDLGQ